MAQDAQNALQRVRALGPRSAAAMDLLAMLFARTEADALQAEAAAREYLARMGNLSKLRDMGLDTLHAAAGLNGYEALRLLAAFELGRRVGNSGTGPTDTVSSPEAVYYLLEHLRHEKREHFVAVLLDSKHHVQRVATIHVGTLTSSVVGPREVFREAIRDAASSIVLAHNHPSGDPTPSPEDISCTKQLVQVGHMLDIPVLDHIIIGDRRYLSFVEEKLMP